MKRLFFLSLLLFQAFISRAGFDYTPALIHLSKAGQHDSIGFNLVSEFPKLIYRKIMSGDVILWQSPEMKVKVSPEALIELENTSKTNMQEVRDLFIHELWRQFRKEFEFNIIGFSFINETLNGSKIHYGYVDAQSIKELLNSTVITTNSNGPASLTYWNALYSKEYYFNIVQFGSNNFQKNLSQSLDLKKSLFQDPKIHSNAIGLAQSKEIHYSLYASNPANQILFDALNAHFNKNKEDFYNLGGDQIISYLNKGEAISISKIEVIELLSKEKGIPGSIVKEVIIYCEGFPLKAVNPDIKIQVNLRPLFEYLGLHEGALVLNRINNQKIPEAQSPFYLKALDELPWNKLSSCLDKSTINESRN